MFKKYINYIKNNPEGYWFKRKPFGWGWTPATREGWIVLGVYILAVLFFAFTIDESSSTRELFFTGILPIILLTIALIRICYTKGEKPKWMWDVPDDIPAPDNRSQTKQNQEKEPTQ